MSVPGPPSAPGPHRERPAPPAPDTYPRSSSDSSTSFSRSSNSILRRGTTGGPARHGTQRYWYSHSHRPPFPPPPAHPSLVGETQLSPHAVWRGSTPGAAAPVPAPPMPARLSGPHAPRSQLRRRLPGWHLRAGRAAPQAPGLPLHPASLGPPTPMPDGRHLRPRRSPPIRRAEHHC